MDEKGKCFEVRSAEGTLLLSLYLREVENSAEGEPDAPGGQRTQEDPSKGDDTNSQNGQAPMTDAQKRYLFSILAEQGFENDNAHQHLKTLFRVDSLQEVRKRQASRMIKVLLEEAEKKK